MVKKWGPVWLIALILLTALYLTIFKVDQTEKAIVLQFGKPVGKPLDPGFHLKVPILHRVVFLDARLLHYDAPSVEILTSDKKNLLVDCFAKWEIVDPLAFMVTAKNEASAVPALSDIVLGEIRTELGRLTMTDIIMNLKSEIMDGLTKRVDKAARIFGIHVLDVRLERVDLPVENEDAVFESMRSERERQARKYMAEGRREAMNIKSMAEKERSILLAEARRKAQDIRGRADAEAAAIYAEAFGKDPEFYRFVRTLELYRKTMDAKATLFMSREDEIMGLMRNSRPASD